MIPTTLECDNVIEMSTDTGVKKTLLNYNDWKKIHKSAKEMNDHKGVF